MSHLLAFEKVALARGGRILFEQLSFTLDPGDAIRVTGPNGCGKSSLLRLAAGLLHASAGHVDRHCDVALSDEFLALDRELPLRQALEFWVERDVEDALAAAGLAGLAAVPVRLLSSGQRKRASLARVYASGAALWLLDEPLNALDNHSAAQLATAISDHRARGGAVLAASHPDMAGKWRTLDIAR